MHFHQILSSLLAVSSVIATPVKRDIGFKYGSDKVRGVNIGGWLVLEPWITPSIFQIDNPDGSIVDEWTLCKNNPNAKSILQKHWDSWVTQDDFQKIADAGFNIVRIPIGYWAYQKVDGDPYIQGAADYIDKAIGWARSTGLKVHVDLHGAPGSQNGYDNSGHRLGQLTQQSFVNAPTWTQGDTVDQTLNVIGKIAGKYAKQSYQDVVVGIELLNEPNPKTLQGGSDAVVQYSKDAYGRVRDVSNTHTIIHDAFQNGSFWDGTLLSPGAQNVIIDHHEYQVFSNEQLQLSPQGHRDAVCSGKGAYANDGHHYVIVGEWTAAMTDCAAGLNGWGIGARYDGWYPASPRIGSCDTINYIDQWSDQLKEDTRRYIEAQLDVFEGFTDGWIFWNFKTEGSPEWDLFRLLDNKIFPQPLTNRKYQSLCSS